LTSVLIIDNHGIEQKDNSWSFHYNFDQFLYEPKKGQGIGIFDGLGPRMATPTQFTTSTASELVARVLYLEGH